MESGLLTYEQVEKNKLIAKNVALELSNAITQSNLAAVLSVGDMTNVENTISTLLAYSEDSNSSRVTDKLSHTQVVREANRAIVKMLISGYGVTQILKLSFYDHHLAAIDGEPRVTLNIHEEIELKSVSEDPDLLKSTIRNRRLAARENLIRLLPSEYNDLTVVKTTEGKQYTITPTIIPIDSLLLLADEKLTADFSPSVRSYINHLAKLHDGLLHIDKKMTQMFNGPRGRQI
ncbi:hypothetical protein OCT63_18255 [Vibrio sp. RW]|uniref:hypothetical protein n=1 Tax=Vibrio sp. RW TaxID=2998833 RepID=UPI0022CD7042|nr:hypothetical protein [Vibrio sp. RW]MDA0146172.1 hypothetical protein [Vibrio sp. RW]